MPSFEHHVGTPTFLTRNGVRYLVMQRAWKTVYKHNTTTDRFVPCAGLVVLFYNDTRDKDQGDGGPKTVFVWHDANNDGSWKSDCSRGSCSGALQ